MAIEAGLRLGGLDAMANRLSKKSHRHAEYDGIKPHKLALVVRRSLVRLRGRVGPEFAKVNLDLLFVRNAEFFDDLARDIGEWGLRLQYEDHNNRRDPELVAALDSVLAAYTSLRREHSYKSMPFSRMVKGETLRRIMHNSPGRLPVSIRDDLAFCVDYIVKSAGISSIYRLI